MKLKVDILMVFTMMVVCNNTHELFNPNELVEGGQTTINYCEPLIYVLALMWKCPLVVKVLTNFDLLGLEGACLIVCSIIYDNLCFINVA